VNLIELIQQRGQIIPVKHIANPAIKAMRLSTTLLYISYTIPLVYAYQSETSIFLYAPSQVERWANLTYVHNGDHTNSSSYWSEPGKCYPSGEPDSNFTLAEGSACNNLPIYHYFDSPTIKPGQTVTIAIEVPGYKLDVSC